MRVYFLGIVALCCILGSASPGYAGTLSVNYDDTGAVWVTSAITDYSTTGADMDGMTVTATFSDGSTNTGIWSATSATRGSAYPPSSPYWSMSTDGDTFTSIWSLINAPVNAQNITSIFIDAGAGNAVFDVWEDPNAGTANSEFGRSFDLIHADGDINIEATYSGRVALAGDFAVGDLYRYLEISFTNLAGLSYDRYIEFRTDTDNIRDIGDLTPVPEPASIMLLGLGLGGLVVRHRRKRS